jgi:hypothetical protein
MTLSSASDLARRERHRSEIEPSRVSPFVGRMRTDACIGFPASRRILFGDLHSAMIPGLAGANPLNLALHGTKIPFLLVDE